MKIKKFNGQMPIEDYNLIIKACDKSKRNFSNFLIWAGTTKANDILGDENAINP